jgi:hypothetical protein
MRKSVLALMVVPFLAMAGTGAVAQTVKDLPKGMKKSSGVVPRMGEHWMDPKNRKNGGPIYGIMNGKIVFFELEVVQKDMMGGKKWDREYEVPAFVGRINHVDTEFMPKGHRNMKVPHYAVHMYTVPHAVHMKYRPKKRGK